MLRGTFESTKVDDEKEKIENSLEDRNVFINFDVEKVSHNSNKMIRHKMNTGESVIYARHQEKVIRKITL